MVFLDPSLKNHHTPDGENLPKGFFVQATESARASKSVFVTFKGVEKRIIQPHPQP